MKAECNWEITCMGNEVLNGDGFFISYKKKPGLPGCNLFDSDRGSDETALCMDGKYLILNGDFRQEYEAVVNEGFEACLEVYKKYEKDFKSSWGDELE